jgi:hypothetical protein
MTHAQYHQVPHRRVAQGPMKIAVDGVELTVEQTVVKKNVYVTVKRKVGRDRKRKLDITGGVETQVEDAVDLLKVLKQVAAFQTARCTCDYCYGYSDHAEHCLSIYVASDSSWSDD